MSWKHRHRGPWSSGYDITFTKHWKRWGSRVRNGKAFQESPSGPIIKNLYKALLLTKKQNNMQKAVCFLYVIGGKNGKIQPWL